MRTIVIGAIAVISIGTAAYMIFGNRGDASNARQATPEQIEKLASQAANDADPAARKQAASKLADLAPRNEYLPASNSSGPASTGDSNAGASSSNSSSAAASTLELRKLAKSDADPEVKASAAQGLGWALDWDSVPQLLKLCDDPSPLVRGRAGAALQQILGADYHFRANDDPQKRQIAIAGMKDYFKGQKGPPPRRKP